MNYKKRIESNKEHLLHVLEESLNEIYMFDSETLEFSYVNKGALLNIGYSMEEMETMTPLDIKPEFDMQSFSEMIEPLRRKEKEKIVFETVHKRADDSLYPIEVHLQLVSDISSPVFMAIILDITDRKRVEEEREHLLHVLEESLNEIYMFDSETLEFSYVNKGALLNIGYSMEEMETMTPLDIKPEFDMQSFSEMIEPLRRKEKEKIVFETVHKRADDSLYPIEVHLQLVSDISRPVFMAIILDITKRKAFENELLQLNENLEKKVEERTASLLSYQDQLRSLASELSMSEENQRQQLATELHDNLGQLLAVGKMKADLLTKDQFSNHTFRNVKKLKEVIDDAITYTRELMSELKPPPSIDDDMRASIEWIAEKVKKRGLKVIIKDDEQPKPLDEEVRTIVLQSVRELLFNVIKHTSENEAIVSLSRNKDQVEIAVKDEGEGFDLENRGLKSEKEKRFGLFNVQERIDLLGGSTDIATEPGEGTTVTLCVPLREEAGGRRGAFEQFKKVNKVKKPVLNEAGYEEGIKVLLVDDHRMVREGLRNIIDGQDDIMVIGEAANGEEAIKLSRETSPDIILMDVSMPGMDGIKATREITSDMPHIRIIGLSLHEEDRVAEQMRNAGASAYLTKTEAFESLIVTIRAEASSLIE